MTEQKFPEHRMNGTTAEPEVVPGVQTRLERAQAHLDAGDLMAALRECDGALQAAPQWAEAHNLRGIVLDEMRRTGEAIAAYQEALRLDPALADTAANLADLQVERRPLSRRVHLAAVALPFLVAMAVLAVVVELQARRGPDWRLVLNEYIAQSALPGEAEPLQTVVTARQPASFTAAMGTLTPGGVLWSSLSPVFPPGAVHCVLLERGSAAGADARRQVVYVAYHSDGLYHIGWRVWEAGQAPFTPQLLADLHIIGCDLPLE